MSEKKENIWMRIILALENTFKPWYDKVEKWAEEKKKASEMKMKVIEKELELIEAELCLEEAIEDMDEELKMREKEEEKKVEVDLQDEEDTSALNNQDERSALEQEEEVEEEEEDEDDVDVAPSSFGSVGTDKDLTKNDQKGNKPGKSPFSTSSLSFASSSLISGVSSKYSCIIFYIILLFIVRIRLGKKRSMKFISFSFLLYFVRKM